MELRANDHTGNSIYEQLTAFTIPGSVIEKYSLWANEL